MKFICAHKFSEKLLDIKDNLNNDKFKSITRPRVIIITIGDNQFNDFDMDLFKEECESLNIKYRIYNYSEDIIMDKLISIIKKLSLNPEVTGIVVQSKLPEHLDYRKIVQEIDPIKDICGVTNIQAGLLQLEINDKTKLVPPIANGILWILEEYIDIKNKTVTIVGNNTNANSISQMCKDQDAITIQCDSSVNNIEKYTSIADIVILSPNKHKKFSTRYFYNKEDRIIVDIPTELYSNGLYKANLNIDDFKTAYFNKLKYICPSEIELMRIVALLNNIYIAYENQFNFIWRYCQNRKKFYDILNEDDIETNIITVHTVEEINNLVWDLTGQYICESQIISKINLDKKNIICFPENIRRVSMSFIEGFVKLTSIEPKNFYKYFSIRGNNTVINKFMDTIRIIG